MSLKITKINGAVPLLPRTKSATGLNAEIEAMFEKLDNCLLDPDFDDNEDMDSLDDENWAFSVLEDK